jgi:RimJ/RimL family protein N-acetyltransferase
VIIETTRLTLRALTPDDAEAIVAGNRAGRSWAVDFPTPGDVNIAGAALVGKVAFAIDTMPWGLFTIVERSSEESIGGIGFKGSPNERGETEIGYGVCLSHQGRGVATEAVLALCDFARRRARVILAETDRDNVASQRVLAKSGFRTCGATDELILWRRELTVPHYLFNPAPAV